MQNCFAKPKNERAQASKENSLQAAQRSENASKKKTFVQKAIEFFDLKPGKNKDKSGPF